MTAPNPTVRTAARQVINKVPWRRRMTQTAVAAALLSAYVVALQEFDRARDTAAHVEDSFANWMFLAAILAVPLVRAAPPRLRDLFGRMDRAGVTSTVLVATSVCLAVTPALLSWLRVRWSYFAIGGILPWSDAGAYHSGGLRLLEDSSLDAFNMRRPMNAGFYALRMALTEQHFWASAILQSVLVGLAACVLLRVIAYYFGVPASLLAAGTLFAFMRDLLDTTMSEPLGFAVGCLAAAALVHGAARPDRWMFVTGLMTMSIALSIRAGALLVLPCLFLWFAAYLARQTKRSWRAIAFAAVAVSAGFLATTSLDAALGTGGGSPNGNFSYTLYGLAHGGTGWTGYQEEFAGRVFPSEAEETDAVYEAALAEIRRNPRQLVQGIRKGYSTYWREGGVFGFAPQPMRWFLMPALYVGIVGGLFMRSRRLVSAMLLAAVAGLLLSVPFIFEDGGHRVLAATAPLSIIPLAVAVAVVSDCTRRAMRWWRSRTGDHDESRSPIWNGGTAPQRPTVAPDRGGSLAAMVAGSCVTAVAVLVLGPYVVLLHSKPDVAAPACEADEVPVVMHAGANTPHISILPRGEVPDDFGEVTAPQFHSDSAYAGTEIAGTLAMLRPSQAVIQGYNLVDGVSAPLVVVPGDQLPRERRLVSLCGRPALDPEAAALGFMWADRLEVLD